MLGALLMHCLSNAIHSTGKLHGFLSNFTNPKNRLLNSGPISVQPKYARRLLMYHACTMCGCIASEAVKSWAGHGVGRAGTGLVQGDFLSMLFLYGTGQVSRRPGSQAGQRLLKGFNWRVCA